MINIYTHLKQMHLRHDLPNTATAIIDDEGQLTYAQLWQEVETFRQKLIDVGLEPRMSLGVMGQNSRHFIIAMLAGLSLDAIVLPISHQLKKFELDQLISESGIHAIIDDLSGMQPTAGVETRLHIGAAEMRFIWTGIPLGLTIASHVYEPALIRFTSGTTGHAKGVVLSHKDIIDRIQNANVALKITPNDTILWVLPMAYHFVVSILLYLNQGATIALAKDFLAANVLQMANKAKATILYAAPMQLRMLAKDTSGTKFAHLRMAIATSSSTPTSVLKIFQERFGTPVQQAFGIIELGLPLFNKNPHTKPQAVGRPVGQFSAAVLTEQGNVVEKSARGELLLRGPGMYSGYIAPVKTLSDTLHQGWFRTGDIVDVDEDGDFFVVGRQKSMINVAGSKVFPEEVETVLLQVPGVEQAHVYGAMHDTFGEVVCADIKARSGISDQHLQAHCRRQLSAYKIPHRIQFVERIAETGSGKVKRPDSTAATAFAR